MSRCFGTRPRLDIQAQCNASGRLLGRLAISLIDAEEEARIRNLIALEPWPQGWDGEEPTGDTVMETVYENGAVHPLRSGKSEHDPTSDQNGRSKIAPDLNCLVPWDGC